MLKTAQEILPSPEELAKARRQDWPILKPIIYMVPKCEELIERITMNLNIMTGLHSFIPINPGRITTCTVCRANLPSAGEYWSSGSIGVADRALTAKESHQPGSVQAFSSTSTYAFELRAADSGIVSGVECQASCYS